MKSDRQAPVAIIGGGFSGTLVAAQLARRGISSVLIEQSGRHGLGAAYSTEAGEHLLNVRATAMSAWPDQRDDFSDYVATSGGDASGFAERRLFGKYVRDLLEQAAALGVEPIAGRVTSAFRTDAGWRLTLDDGGEVDAAAAVLAIGNQPPQSLRALAPAGERLINNPWGPQARAAIGKATFEGSDVLVVGTGLTMIDVVLSLDAAGHRGRMVAVSRRGLIPRAHAEPASAPVDEAEVPKGDLVGLLRWLRRRSAEVGWRAAVDSLRPHSHRLWQALGPDQQRRFLRHGRPWWDVHRHRIAPEIASRLRGMIEEGRLEIVAGRIIEAEDVHSGVAVRMARRGSAAGPPRQFAYVFNCTGPLVTMERTKDPLLGQMLGDGLVQPDALGMGIEVDDGSRVDGAPRLWAVGPLTKGRFWEIVAVPDIRLQADQIAADIAKELGR